MFYAFGQSVWTIEMCQLHSQIDSCRLRFIRIALAKLAFYSSVCKKYTVYTLSTTQAMTDYQHIAHIGTYL